MNVPALRVAIDDIGVSEHLLPYLEASGWMRADTDLDKWFILIRAKDGFADEIELVFPKNSEVPDISSYIVKAVDLVASLENLTREKALLSIRFHDWDLLYVRSDVSGQSNSLSLQAAAEQVRRLRDAVAWAACSEKVPRPSFLHRLRAASTMTSHFRFGQTFAGSFGFTIQSHVRGSERRFEQLRLAGDNPPLLEASLAPFERRVMERVIRGLISTKSATEAQNSEQLVASYGTGFSANVCTAISALRRSQIGRMEFSVDWSRKIAPAPDLASVKEVELFGASTIYLDSAADQLRSMKPEEAFVIGTVIGLTATGGPPLEDEAQRSVVVSGVLSTIQRQARVLVIGLRSSDYQIAHHAHLNNETVRVSGIVSRGPSGGWRLSDASVSGLGGSTDSSPSGPTPERPGSPTGQRIPTITGNLQLKPGSKDIYTVDPAERTITLE